ncbi:hypothetical protein C0995_003946 [Termitomyces sp. Mi166|nr:hypothetical protein C0995_003946 [Termitomyces sp. Mi166\
MIVGLSPETPLICDADTSFGGPVMVARTVTAYARAGVAGLHIEDQTHPKRCGHLLGKQIAPISEFIARIRAAAAARAKIPGCDIVLIAGTDAAQSLGMDEALKRLKFAIEAGADVAFLEGVRSREEVARTIQELSPTPSENGQVLLNVVHGGSTPDFTVEDAKALGVKITIFPLVTAAPAIHGIRAALLSLKTMGSDVPSAKGMGPKQFFDVMVTNPINYSGTSDLSLFSRLEVRTLHDDVFRLEPFYGTHRTVSSSSSARFPPPDACPQVPLDIPLFSSSARLSYFRRGSKWRLTHRFPELFHGVMAGRRRSALTDDDSFVRGPIRR